MIRLAAYGFLALLVLAGAGSTLGLGIADRSTADVARGAGLLLAAVALIMLTRRFARPGPPARLIRPIVSAAAVLGGALAVSLLILATESPDDGIRLACLAGTLAALASVAATATWCYAGPRTD